MQTNETSFPSRQNQSLILVLSRYSLKTERSLWLNFEALPFSIKYIQLLPNKALLCQVLTQRSILKFNLCSQLYISIQFKFHTKDCIIYPFNKHNCESWGSNVVRPARSCIRFPSSFN
ncbi:hypothetical protein ALC56_02268 [Trachymyrmex septentrionalis]|uniref:Uncharacterized protein n=1 Tax=Trachymyrmex septentrionalis TaxID=34720 RepID=A0A195FRU0_9HYME|nr:hypothetical protein ALC56_02268 [Trachymyrmex septentrionalis]